MNVILISDLDGTLLDENNKLPQSFPHFLYNLRQKGIDLLFASSRSPQNIHNLFKGYDFSYYAICSDGASFVKIEQQSINLISQENIDSVETCRALKTLTNLKIAPILLFTNHSNNYDIITIDYEIPYDSIIFKLLSDGRRNVNYHSIEQLLEKRDLISSVRAITCFDSSDVIDRIYDRISIDKSFNCFKLYKYIETRYQENAYSWLDIMPKDLSKGKIVSKFKDTILENKFVIGLGNDINDIEMLELSDICFCPINANSKVKEISKIKIVNHCNGDMFLTYVSDYLNNNILIWKE